MYCNHRAEHATPPTRSSYPLDGSSPGHKWIKSLTNDRAGQFTGGRWSSLNLSSVLYTERIDDKKYVELSVWSAPGRSKPTFEEAMRNKFKPAKKGDHFGPSWTNHWWKVKLHVPTAWTKYERVQFEFDPSCEAMIFDVHGTPLQGITGGWGGERRVEHIIPPAAVKAGIYEIVIESSCNGLFGVGDSIEPPNNNRWFGLWTADIVVPNMEAWRLMLDYNTLRQLSDNLPGNSPTQNHALVLQNKIMNTFRNDDPSTIAQCRKIAEEILGEGWESKGADIYDKNVDALIYGIGYCHIDTAWLWPYSVTQQKVARSWTTQVDLMNRYPEHRFTCSSAQQFKWLEQLYPAGFKAVKDKVLAGKFHPVGGAWVEHDGNMPSGEALIRQNLLGQRYFQSRFGVRCVTAWLPDSFGLSGALPQIFRLCGMKNFFTQKLSWNNVNVFPHTTFNWTGIDGTQVLCHMTPVDTYNAQATFGDVRRGITNHKNLESSNTALLVFGNGDGGGGPLPNMLDSLRRIRAAANQTPDVPVVHMGTSVEDFYADIERDTNYGETLPTWHGELYLEFHRGTYTSHGSIKRGNRKSEILLREVEYVATMASLHGKDYEYPYDRINECWEKVCLNQFHDVLPGSAIGMVYEDAEKLYGEVARDGKQLFKEAVSAYMGNLIPIASVMEEQLALSNGKLVAFNTVHHARREVVEIPLKGPSATRLRKEVVQISKDGTRAYALMDGDDNAGGLLQAKGLYADIKPVTAMQKGDDEFILTNSNISMTIKGGRITSLYDMILQRELLIKGMTGGLVIFDDRPNYWDAWDVEIFHLETREPLSFSKVTLAESGPVRAALRAELKLPKSTVKVTISLDATPATFQPNSRSLIRFDAEVDWHERHRFLKFELPLNIRAHDAYYETQFGHVSRPTHKNTTWDAAKFEVCCHKYCDISEFGYGVAFLNDCKYGASADGQFMRLSLLRAATAPDAEQDQGKHEFSWAVLPHATHFMQSDVPIAAQFFNSPLHVMYAPESGPLRLALPTVHKSPFSVEGAPNVVLETVKRGEDDTKKKLTRVVLRIFEAYGGHASATLRVASHLSIDRAYTTNLLEEKISALETSTHEATGDTLIKLDLHAFQILTVRLTISKVEMPSSRRRSEEWVAV